MSGFSPAQLPPILTRLPVPRRYLLAYSGGLDSHVLLQAVAALRPQLPAPVSAVHVNHGLHAAAGRWATHCRGVCEGLGLELAVHDVDARARPGESPEAAARRARYALFAELMHRGDMLLTAHHEDDQAETLLLQLLRGAGPHGLAAMPELKPFADGWQARPLLGFSRGELAAYAQRAGLMWIHDSSNDEPAFKRNYLRHEVIPRLRQQWPAVSRTLSRSAGLCADAAAILDSVAEQDLAALQDDDGLSLAGLLRLSSERQRNLLRHWCVRLGLPLPARVHLQQVQQQVAAPADQVPVIRWPGAELRRYRQRLYLMAPMPAVDTGVRLDWDLDRDIELPLGRLSVHMDCRDGLSTRIRRQRVQIGFRVGGERIVTGSGHHRPLKKLFQEYRVLPWWRSRMPLVYVDDELVAVADIVIDDRFRAKQGEPAIRIEWQK